MQRKVGGSFFIGVAVMVCGCTSDSVLEEEFEGSTFDFPLLGTVPDRPDLPDPALLAAQRKHLQADHDQAIRKEAEVKKSVSSEGG